MALVLPKRRPVVKSGIQRAERRVYPRHRRFVRSHGCVIPNCDAQDVDFCHLHSVGAGGHDKTGVSMCRRHHAESHTSGLAKFQAKYGVDLWALAAEFVRRSTDTAMRAALAGDG